MSDARDLSPLLDGLLDLLAERVASRLADRQPAPARTRTPLLTKQDLAVALAVSSTTIDRLVRDGRIPFVMVAESRRFDLDDVRTALQQACRPSVAKVEPPEAGEVRYAKRRR